jgi:hypothetical protein
LAKTWTLPGATKGELMSKDFNFLEQMALDCGFDSEEDMNKMILSVDLSKESSKTAFQRWKVEDGTKGKLLRLIESKIIKTLKEEE